MNVLVTGGAGFIGSNLAIGLISRGYEVKILDNLSTGKMENLDDIRGKVTFIKGDVRNLPLLKNLMKGVDVVFHLAALTSHHISLKNPLLVNNVNIDGTLKVLIAAKECNVKRVVYASSASIYGNTSKLPISETTKLNPLTTYALSKLVGESYCNLFYKMYGLEAVSLRYFNIFGPKQNFNSEYAAVIPKFMKRVFENKPPIIYGDGNQTRDFVFVQDAVEATILAMEKEEIAGETLNIGSGKRTTINQLAQEIIKLANKDFKPIHKNARKGDIRHSCANIKKAEKLLGYKPKYTLKRGLKISWESFLKNFK